MSHVVVHNGKAYGPFHSNKEALSWIAVSNIADDDYSVFPLNPPTDSLGVDL